MSLDRMLTLAGFDKKQDALSALKLSKSQLVEAHDLAIKQVERGLPVDEGLLTGLRAALATVASGSVKATKSLARKAAELGDNVRKLYLDEKAKIELKNLLKGMLPIAAAFEKLEKDSPTIIKKDERVREIIKVFRDAMDTMVRELKVRSVPESEVTEALTDARIDELVEALLRDEELLNEEALTRQMREFMSQEGYAYKGTTVEEVRKQHAEACKRAPKVDGSDLAFCNMLKIPVKNGKIAEQDVTV